MDTTTTKPQRFRHHVIQLGNNLVEVKYAPKSLQNLEGGLMYLASLIAKREVMRGHLVIIDPQVNEERLTSEWANALEALRVDVKERLSLAIVKDNKYLRLPENIDQKFRAKLDELVKEQAQTGETHLRPKNNYYEILKVLIIRWLNKREPITAKDLAKDAGCTYPTVADAITRLGSLIKRGPKKTLGLSQFPIDEWSNMVAEADRARSTIWFADRSGQPRTPDSLRGRLEKLNLPNVAVGGVYGGKYYYPDLDLIGDPRLVLSVHCDSNYADLKFVDRLDPALQRIYTPRESAIVYVHFIRRSQPCFAKGPGGLSVADPLECLLDLHEARLESQALSFLAHITSQRQGWQ